MHQFFADRFDDDGQVRDDVQPAVPFTPGLISARVAQANVGDELDKENLWLFAADITDHPTMMTSSILLRQLSRVQRARAASWLTNVRVGMHDLVAKHEDADEDEFPRYVLDPGLAMVDRVLGWLRREAIRQIPDARALRDLTPTPPASQAPQLRAALSPPAPVASRREPSWTGCVGRRARSELQGEAEGGIRPPT